MPVPKGPPATVGSLTAAFAAAGANATYLPPMSATPLGAYASSYDLTAWEGGPYQFVSCDLPRRGAEYVGTCTPKTVDCTPSSVDGVPYACTRREDNASVAGSLSSSAYREGCEVPCDLELDCGALCACGDDGCGAGEVRAGVCVRAGAACGLAVGATISKLGLLPGCWVCCRLLGSCNACQQAVAAEQDATPSAAGTRVDLRALLETPGVRVRRLPGAAGRRGRRRRVHDDRRRGVERGRGRGAVCADGRQRRRGAPPAAGSFQ